MGTAHVVFRHPSWDKNEKGLNSIIECEIWGGTLRAIVENMEQHKPDDLDWKGRLEGAYGIDYLYVGNGKKWKECDFGPAFIEAVSCLLRQDLPSYFDQKDKGEYCSQLAELRDTYKQAR